MTRTATWNRIGTAISKAQNVEEALSIANLNYEVEKVPVFLENGFQVPGAFATKKVGMEDTFGVVGEKYEVVQNLEAFNFVDTLIPEGMKFIKAGETTKMIYIIASLPDTYILDDKVTPYLIFQNSHCGKSTLRATITPLRIICQNQFIWAFRKASNKITIRHTRSAKERLEAAKSILLQNSEYLDQFKLEAEKLATTKISKGQLDAVIQTTFPISPEANAKSITKIEEKREKFLLAYNAEDNQNFKGTAWGLVNAYSDFTTHKELRKETETAMENHFIKTTLKGEGLTPFIQNLNTIIH